jgi:tRNA nucleotidyltransferase (CCA-adding enzyme)
MDISQIKEDILDKYRPDGKAFEIAQKMQSRLLNAAKELDLVVQIDIGGSTAKNTYLKDDFDCDMFLRFDSSYLDGEISQLAQNMITHLGDSFEVLHGSRDYFQLEFEGVTFELVPVQYITDPAYARNVTDMSPMHVQWVNERTKNTNLCDEIRLAKVFCKAQRVYGAESYISGFSGHILDILVLQYGGFIELLEAASKWDFVVVLDPAKHYVDDPLKHLNESKIGTGGLIIVDPVLADRNAAAALIREKRDAFIVAATQFLANPDVSFFQKKDWSKKDFEGNVLQITFVPKDGKKDVVGAKLKKAYEYILQQIEQKDFEIVDSGWEWDTCYIGLESLSISEEMIVQGPPLRIEHRVNSFKEAHKETYEEDGRIFAKEKRDFTDVVSFIESLKSDQFIQSKVDEFTITR